MLPLENNGQGRSNTIYINPNFKMKLEPVSSTAPTVNTMTVSGIADNKVPAHINPLFLHKNRSNTIYMNPQFFGQQLVTPDLQSTIQQPTQTSVLTASFCNAQQQAQKQQSLQHKQLEKLKQIQRIQQEEQLQQTQETQLQQQQHQYQQIERKLQTVQEQSEKLTQQQQHEKISEKQMKLNEQSMSLQFSVFQKDNHNRKIISKSRTSIVREPMVQKKDPLSASLGQSSMLKIGKLKLIRKIARLSTLQPGIPEIKKTCYTMTKYKVDNRSSRTQNITMLPPITKRRRVFVARFALQRSSAKSVVSAAKSNLSPLNKSHTFIRSPNKTLQHLNINGIIYKCTNNKLQRKDMKDSLITKAENISKLKRKMQNGRTLFVSGIKFIMDLQGYKLKRVMPNISISGQIKNQKDPSTSYNMQRQRIDIGGVTYVASSEMENTFVRTKNHLTIQYLNYTKHRSLNQLTKRFVKTNVPCPIYRRLGKCAAFECNKCSKLHDKKQIIICSRFLQNECMKPNCLLSHDVSYCKMPVCMFYLQGNCVRDVCPYLHKKLSDKTPVCSDFSHGYCMLADKCKKRHEFACHDAVRKECSKLLSCNNSKYFKRYPVQVGGFKDDYQNIIDDCIESSPKKKKSDDDIVIRYFHEKFEEDNSGSTLNQSSDDEDDEGSIESKLQSINTIKTKDKLGVLPAYIPL